MNINIHEEWQRARLDYRDELRHARRWYHKGIIDLDEYIEARTGLINDARRIYQWYKGMTKHV
jgi:hypothetical protein